MPTGHTDSQGRKKDNSRVGLGKVDSLSVLWWLELWSINVDCVDSPYNIQNLKEIGS